MKTQLLVWMAVLSLGAAPARADEEHHEKRTPASQSLRDEHKAVLEHLGHVKEWALALRDPKPKAQRENAQRILQFFEQHIRPHAEAEERTLYPLVDELTGTQKWPFTSSMRHEHQIVGRWISELAAELKKDAPDFTAFARRTDNLLGLLWAHFEEEEQVLLPIVDSKLTREQFEARVRSGGERHHGR